MADRGDHLHEVLDGYAKFLQEKKLALDRHQPYLVRWVREFLLFARTHAGYSFEDTLDLWDYGATKTIPGAALQNRLYAARLGRAVILNRPKTSSSESPMLIGGPFCESISSKSWRLRSSTAAIRSSTVPVLVNRVMNTSLF